MPGSPLAGLLQHLNSAQSPGTRADPDLPGTPRGRQPLDPARLHRLPGDVVRFDFGISTSNYPTPVSEVVRRTPLPIFLVGFRVPASVRPRHGDRDGRRVRRARRRQRHRHSSPSALCRRSSPLLGLYFFGLRCTGSRSSTYDTAHLSHSWAFLASTFRHAQLPILVTAHLHGRLGAEHAHRDDQHDQRGLRGDGAR